MRDLRAKVLFDLFDGRVGVFDDVVEQSGGHTHRIELELGEDVCHFKRVNEVRFAGFAHLAAVFARGKQVCAPQELFIGARVVLSNLLDYGFEANHAQKEKGWRPFFREPPQDSSTGGKLLHLAPDSGAAGASFWSAPYLSCILRALS